MITKFLRNLSLCLIFLIPFIVLLTPSDPSVQNPSSIIFLANSFFFPFISTKGFVFRIIVEIVFALWLLLVIRDKKYAPKSSWVSLSVGLFVVVILATDLMGLNPLRSIWSNFERMEGWITLVHFWAYFVVTTCIFGSGEEGKRMWHKFFNTTLIAAGLVAFYGLLQLTGAAAIHQGSSRIDASLGNAAYMAVYMLFHTFLAFYMALVVWAKRQKASGVFWMYTVLGVIFAFFLFETATRGTILGLVGGLMLALGIYAVFGKQESKKSRGISVAIIALFIILGATLVAGKNTAFVKSHETLNRLASISIKDTTTQARGYIWPMAVSSIFSSPKTALVGVGQENFNYIFNANYNPKMWTQEQWFDRAHNVFLDWLVAGGLIGFVLYISLFVLAISGIWKSVLTFKEKCLLTGMFVGYAIHNIFVFDNFASYLLFFTTLGFTHSLRAEKPIAWLEINPAQSENAVVVRDYIFFPIIVIAFCITLYFVNVRPMKANLRLIDALASCSSGGTPSTALYARALEMDQTMANQEIREHLASCAGNVITNSYSTETKSAFYALALKEIKNQIATTPNDARGYVIGGSFLNGIGDWATAQPILEKAHALSPRKQTIDFMLATNYFNTGKEKEAAVLLEKAYNDAPDNPTSRTMYIAALILSGQEAKARAIFATTTNAFQEPIIANSYVKMKQYEPAIEIYKTLIASEPNNLEYYGGLMSVYASAGRYSEALQILDVADKQFPLQKASIEAARKEVQARMKK